MGSCVSVAAILQAMEGKYGAVAPLDVMMKKLLSLNQGKTESVTNFAIRLESTLANIQRDHPTQVTRIQMDASPRDRFWKKYTMLTTTLSHKYSIHMFVGDINME